jgi:DNA polymerase-4
MPRWVLHVDMDEFYVAVERLDNPSLRGKCVLVGGDANSRGVVSTASYEARKFGCHSAMPMATALKHCPHAIVLPVRMERYAEVSLKVFDIFHRFSPIVEPVSIDEAFLDISGCERLHGPATKVAYDIQRAVRDEVGLACSIGIAPNKFLAKIASDLEKPFGMVLINEETIHKSLDPLPVTKMWGVGKTTARRLEEINIHTIGQMRKADPALLTDQLGDLGELLLGLAAGIDARPVLPASRTRSFSAEETFATDVDDLQILRNVLFQQVEHIASRLRRGELKARTITLKLRRGENFQTLTRSRTLLKATNTTEAFWAGADELLNIWAGESLEPLRLLGFGVSQLVGIDGEQLELFVDEATDKAGTLDATLDAINDRFGQAAIRRAGV